MIKYFNLFITTDGEKVNCFINNDLNEFDNMKITFYDCIDGKLKFYENKNKVELINVTSFINSDILTITLQDEETALYFKLKFSEYIKGMEEIE